MTSKEFSKKFKKHLKESDERLSKIRVRKGTGTASSWVEISGSLQWGTFTEDEKAALKEMGIITGMNACPLDWEDQEHLTQKFNI